MINEMDVAEKGKGNEVAEKSTKRPFRCRHRWCLVTKRVLRLVDKSKSAGIPNSPAILLVQVCRGCGCFRETVYAWALNSWKINVTRQIKLIPADEGTFTSTFEWKDGRPAPNE